MVHWVEYKTPIMVVMTDVNSHSSTTVKKKAGESLIVIINRNNRNRNSIIMLVMDNDEVTYSYIVTIASLSLPSYRCAQ